MDVIYTIDDVVNLSALSLNVEPECCLFFLGAIPVGGGSTVSSWARGLFLSFKTTSAPRGGHGLGWCLQFSRNSIQFNSKQEESLQIFILIQHFEKNIGKGTIVYIIYFKKAIGGVFMIRMHQKEECYTRMLYFFFFSNIYIICRMLYNM